MPSQEERGPSGKVVLSVGGLSLSKPDRHGWRTALDGVAFDLAEGEILGIGGLLGSGRTEILETIFGSSGGRANGEIRLDASRWKSVRRATPAGSASPW